MLSRLLIMDSVACIQNLCDFLDVKAQKQHQKLFAGFKTNLHDEILRYVSENSLDEVFSSGVINILQTALKSNGDGFEDAKKDKCNTKGDIDVKMQSLLITGKIKPFLKTEEALFKTLVSLLAEANYSDFVIKVNNEEFLVHKDILCARSSYFRAMLQTSSKWSETTEACTVLNGVSAEAFSIYLCYMYGAFINCVCNKMDEILELVKVADMFEGSDMMEAIVVFLQRDLCHFFHKPCSECIFSTSLMMQICQQFNLTKLYKKCLKWNSKYFRIIWPMKSFSSLSTKTQKQIYLSVIESLSAESVVRLTLESDGLIGHLASVGCARSVVCMADDLMDECQNFVVTHLFELTENHNIGPLFQGMWYRRNVTEEILEKVVSQLNEDNACLQYLAVQKLMHVAEHEEWSRDTIECLRSTCCRVTNYLTTSYYAVIHSESWNLLSAAFKEELKASTLCQGDAMRKPRPKPVLSSSKKCSTPRKVISKPSETRKVTTKSIQTNLSVRKKAKLTRNSSMATAKECLGSESVIKNAVESTADESSSSLKGDDLPTAGASLGRLEYSEECKSKMLPPIVVTETLFQPLTSSTAVSEAYAHLLRSDMFEK